MDFEASKSLSEHVPGSVFASFVDLHDSAIDPTHPGIAMTRLSCNGAGIHAPGGSCVSASDCTLPLAAALSGRGYSVVAGSVTDPFTCEASVQDRDPTGAPGL